MDFNTERKVLVDEIDMKVLDSRHLLIGLTSGSKTKLFVLTPEKAKEFYQLLKQADYKLDVARDI